MRRYYQGFSAIELVVALAIVSLIAALGYSAINTLSLRQSLNYQTLLVSAFQNVRNQAVMGAQSISICVVDPNTKTCDTSPSRDWTMGWYVYRGAGFSAFSAENILFHQEKLKQTQAVRITDNFGGQLIFNKLGGLDRLGSLYICDTTTPQNNIRLVMITTGRIRYEQGSYSAC